MMRAVKISAILFFVIVLTFPVHYSCQNNGNEKEIEARIADSVQVALKRNKCTNCDQCADLCQFCPVAIVHNEDFFHVHFEKSINPSNDELTVYSVAHVAPNLEIENRKMTQVDDTTFISYKLKPNSLKNDVPRDTVTFDAYDPTKDNHYIEIELLYNEGVGYELMDKRRLKVKGRGAPTSIKEWMLKD